MTYCYCIAMKTGYGALCQYTYPCEPSRPDLKGMASKIDQAHYLIKQVRDDLDEVVLLDRDGSAPIVELEKSATETNCKQPPAKAGGFLARFR